MPENCTCGAQLPPDARFCHRCGKPQREEILEESLPVRELEIPPATTPIAAMPQGVSFHNPIAVRIGLMMASIAALLTMLLLFGFVIWWVSAGFFSVYLYRRRTGEVLSVSGGLRMGWLTGVLTFVIMTVLMTMGFVAAALQSGGLGAFYAELLRSRQFNEATIQETVRAMNNPSMLATGIILTLIFTFAMITVFCTAGGALGAKLAGKQ
ncbi:MAG: zinc ribbon domain-containing protein [Bryobacteraceae bacterium]